jgi:hypothetical protein
MCEVAHKHAENCGTAADVEDYLVFEQVPILVYRIAVGPRSHFVFLREEMMRSASFERIREQNHSNLPTFLHESL